MRTSKGTLFIMLILSAQFGLVLGPAPFYGLYYNTLLLLGFKPQDLFQLPEPAYGLDVVANYVKSHPSYSRIILTDVAPHLVHDYLPNYWVIMDRGIRWTGNVTTDFDKLISLQVSYVIIGAFATQVNPNSPLERAASRYGAVVSAPTAAGIPVAKLYQFERPIVHDVMWGPTSNENWNLTTSEGNRQQLSYVNGLVLPFQFTTAYPPSQWVKATIKLPSVADASLLRFTASILNNQSSGVSITLALTDLGGNVTETVLIDSSLGIVPEWKPDRPLQSVGTAINLTMLSSIAVTVYNAGSPATGSIVVTNPQLVD